MFIVFIKISNMKLINTTNSYFFRYCKKIVIYDLTNNKKYIYTVQKRFSLKQYECTEAIVGETHFENQMEKYNIFTDNIIFGFRELHLWLSIFLR